MPLMDKPAMLAAMEEQEDTAAEPSWHTTM